MHWKSESDVTSVPFSSTPSRLSTNNASAVYYVQSPSEDPHDAKSSSRSSQVTPSDFPTYPSSISSRYYIGLSSPSSGASGSWERKKLSDWGVNEVIEEAVNEETRRIEFWLLSVIGFIVLFSMFCFIIWGIAFPFKPNVVVQMLDVHNFYYAQGVDRTGVPTKLMTVNCSVHMTVHNPATFFGIHVSSSSVNLLYSQITVATGEIKKFYQPRKSSRIVTFGIAGKLIPLYGAGSTLPVAGPQISVPMTLTFVVQFRGEVVGKLIQTRHSSRVSCTIVIGSVSNEAIQLNNDSCTHW